MTSPKSYKLSALLCFNLTGERDSTSNVGPQAEDGRDSVARGESKIQFDPPKCQDTVGTIIILFQCEFSLTHFYFVLLHTKLNDFKYLETKSATFNMLCFNILT